MHYTNSIEKSWFTAEPVVDKTNENFDSIFTKGSYLKQSIFILPSIIFGFRRFWEGLWGFKNSIFVQKLFHLLMFVTQMIWIIESKF